MHDFVGRLRKASGNKSFKVRVKGGPGSGDWGHRGRPGKRGGSAGGKMGGGGMSRSALVSAANRAGTMYFGDALIFHGGERDVRTITKQDAHGIEAEIWDSLPDDATTSDVPLIDPDFAYPLVYDSETGAVSQPEGYDSHRFSSSDMFTREYVNEWNTKNTDPNKKLMSYDSTQDAVEVWPKLGRTKLTKKVPTKKAVTKKAVGNTAKLPSTGSTGSGKPDTRIVKYTFRGRDRYEAIGEHGIQGRHDWEDILEKFPGAVKPTITLEWNTVGGEREYYVVEP